MSVFGVILVGIFPHLDWIRRDTACLDFISMFILFKYVFIVLKVHKSQNWYFGDNDAVPKLLRISNLWMILSEF